MTQSPQPLRNTANPAPVQPHGSIRRTTSIDVSWLGGPETARKMHGRARDFIRNPDGAGQICAEAQMTAEVNIERTITEISAHPAPARLGELVGQRGGGHLRMVLAQVLPELSANGSPLYLILDDISGTSLVSSWAWSLWQPDAMDALRQAMPDGTMNKLLQDRAGICHGLQLGHSGMDPTRENFGENSADGKELRNPADPDGWHSFPEISGISMRRARRIDVWRDATSGLIHIDSAFQDSAPAPTGGRAALHEYRLSATVDAATLTLQSITPEPRVLPFHECPGAVANALKMAGTSLHDIRAKVLTDLRGTAGCTHLNDALRALGEVPMMLEKLPA
ncbi:MAG: hypothetical protein RLY97_1402 [Pseudomonadota bacterium]